MTFSITPQPHTEAAALIAAKPAITRDVFDSLEPELKARAFTITGIEDATTLQAVRDQIASLPLGADWKKVRTEVARTISPWFTPAAAAARADLLLSHHAFTAYAASRARLMDAQIDTFPYRQYLSTKDGKVRAAHRALDGIILRADHPFWQGHTPPWEFRCRCNLVELLEDEALQEMAADRDRLPEDRRVLTGAALTNLENNYICRGPSITVQLGKSLQSVPALNLPLADLTAKWDTLTKAAFQAAHPAAEIPSSSPRLRASAFPSSSRPASFAAALDAAGLTTKPAWSRADLANLRASLRVQSPAAAADLIASISGARKTGVLTDREIRRTVQDLLDILPKDIAATLPKLTIGLQDAKLGDANGVWSPAANHIRITTAASLKGLKGEPRRREMRRILSHELMHWVHDSAKGPAADAYRAKIKAHYHTRTATDTAEPDGHGGFYRPDKFWKKYVGREYKQEAGQPAGAEIPATHFELWETPQEIMFHAGPKNPDSAAFRETFSLVHSLFDSTP